MLQIIFTNISWYFFDYNFVFAVILTFKWTRYTIISIVNTTFGTKENVINWSRKIIFGVSWGTMYNKCIPGKTNVKLMIILVKDTMTYLRWGAVLHCLNVTFIQPLKWRYISFPFTLLCNPDMNRVLRQFNVSFKFSFLTSVVEMVELEF
jgi:hypothetical protein